LAPVIFRIHYVQADHPHPGMAYKGIRRTAYLPDNQQGRQICCMLTVAFERRLVFTIGTSRTTGKESVITWNDVHHKTDMKPNTQ
jgi:deltex-like protein